MFPHATKKTPHAYAAMRTKKRTSASGFTLVELLVVIAIISMLIALLMPAVQSARESARNVQCKNNMRQTYLASLNYSTSKGDTVPGYGRYTQVTSNGSIPSAAQLRNPNNLHCLPGHSWVVTLLPYFEQNNIADRWKRGGAWNSPSNAQLGTIPLSTVVCPSDDTSQNGGLSYVINSGYGDMRTLAAYSSSVASGQLPSEANMHAHNMLQFDWNQDGQVNRLDHAVTRDTGMSWVHVGNNNFSHRFDDVYDGSSNTILFSENVNAGGGLNWSDPAINNCAFIYPVYLPRVSGRNFPNPPQPAGLTGLPDREKRRGEGTPFPSSNHRGTVNYVTAGGATKSMAADIDGMVYRALLTPSGGRQRFSGFVAEPPVAN